MMVLAASTQRRPNKQSRLEGLGLGVEDGRFDFTEARERQRGI